MEGYHDIHSYPGAGHLPGLVIYRFDGPLFFANATTFRDEIRRLAKAQPQPTWILIAAEPVTDVDTTASDVLEDLDEELNARAQPGVRRTQGPGTAQDRTLRADPHIDPRHFYPTLGAAMRPSATKPAPSGPRPTFPRAPNRRLADLTRGDHKATRGAFCGARHGLRSLSR